MIQQKEEIQGQEDYPFPEEKEEVNEEMNLDCRCPELRCPRHGNCKACKEYHHKNLETTYCGK